MKSLLPLFVFTLLLAGRALAQEPTLFEIAGRSLDLAESIAECAARGDACAREDVELFQAAGESDRQELYALLRSGDVNRLALTPAQAQILKDRAGDLKGRLIEIQMLDGICNEAIAGVGKAFYSFIYGIFFWVFIVKFFATAFFLPNLLIAVLAALVVLPFLVFQLALGFLIMPALSACLLWWL